MKFRTLINCSIFLFLICCWACQSGEFTPNGEKPILDSIHLRSGLEHHYTYQIAGRKAKEYIAEYEAYIDKVDSTIVQQDTLLAAVSPGKLIYGTKVDLKELKEVLDSSNLAIDELYLMLGILGSDSTEMIFSLASIDGVDTTWNFFDFTMPCPTACPKFSSSF